MTTAALDPRLVEAQKVSYCIPTWLRDEQIRLAIARVKRRIQPQYELRTEPIAVVCYGPSLAETWEQVRGFKYIITSSGAHKFLLDKDIVPTWHLDVDPRKHKADLIGTPHEGVEYLMASACHPRVFDLLEGYTVTLWHIFDNAEEGQRILPHGEWALTGGCSAGLRTLTMARFLGFTDLHVFGMDGCEGASGKHAGAHPNQAKMSMPFEYDGVTYQTTAGFLEAARGTFHELDQMSDVKATFYGNGLVQHMAKHYTPKHVKGTPEIAIIKDRLISDEYRALNARLHKDNLAYGVGGGKYAERIQEAAEKIKAVSVLDYGCGKGYLGKALPFPIWEYDPAVPGKDAAPRAADLVTCLDVLEHIEPDHLDAVLSDLRRCVKQVGYFVIHTGPAAKVLADGRNAHLIQQPKDWWHKTLSHYFEVGKIDEKGPLLHVIVGPSVKKPKVLPAPKFSFDGLRFRRDPYPIGCASNVLEPNVYRALSGKFPDVKLCAAFGANGQNKKWSLSERNNPENYHAFIGASQLWSAFHAYIKSTAFVDQMRIVLLSHGLDPIPKGPTYQTRWEYSLLPADGGCLRPHTDIPSKLVTLVVSMLPEVNDWNPAWGGGTDVLKPRAGFTMETPPDPDDFSHFDVVDTFHYVPNQCVVFVKTDNSWHSVGPLKGAGSDALRRSLTINIEKPA